MKDYSKLIKEEAQHFANYLVQRQKRGVSTYVDLELGERLVAQNPHIEDDPEVAAILYGKYRNEMIIQSSGSHIRALELGSGGGWLSLELARRSTQVHAIELSLDQILLAKKHMADIRYKNNLGSVHYICADLNNISLPPKHYDRVLAFNVLHHLINLNHVLSEVMRTLKKDGKFFIYDHIGPDSISRILEQILTLVLPSHLTPYNGIRGKLAAVLKKLQLLPKDYNKHLKHSEVSPFEGVNQASTIESICTYFTIESIETNLAFCTSIAARMKDTRYKYKLVHLLKKIDDILIKLGISRGRFVFIVARPKE